MDALITLHELNHCFQSAKELLKEASAFDTSLVEQEVLLEMADYYTKEAQRYLLALVEQGKRVSLVGETYKFI